MSINSDSIKIHDIKSKYTHSFKGRYKLLKEDMDLQYKTNIKIFIAYSDDKFIISFDNYTENTTSSIEYRSKKFSYLRSLKYNKSTTENAKEKDLIELYLDTKSEENSLKDILSSQNYLAYIENYDNDFLFLVIYEFDYIRINDLNIYYTNGNVHLFNKDFILNTGGSHYIIIASNSSKYYLVGKNKYLEINYNDNILSILDFRNTVKSLEDDNYLFTLYCGTHRFYNIKEEHKRETKIKNSDLNDYRSLWEKYEAHSIDSVMTSFYNAKYLEYSGGEYISDKDDSKDYLIFNLIENGNKESFIDNTSNANTSSLYVSKENIYEEILNKLKEKKKKENLDSIKELEFISNEFKTYEKKVFSFEYTNKLTLNSNKIYLERSNDDFDFKNNSIGYIFYFPQGDYQLHRRRNAALEAIRNNKAAMPNLNALLFGKDGEEDSYVATKREKKILAISENTLQKVFKGSTPTENQRKAIEIALNTPDIAIIQGPPGTGKTTVISAILTRLSEEACGDKRDFANDLISAYQHDAVNNCIKKVGNFGLPAIEVGAKNSLDFFNEITNWLNKMIEKFSKAHPHIVIRNKHKALEDKILSLLSMRDIQVDMALDICDDILKESCISIDLKNSIISFQRKQSVSKAKFNINKDIKDLLYKIPTKENAYKDNGFYILNNVILMIRSYPILLEDSLIKKILDFLEDFVKEPKDFNRLLKAKRVLFREFLKTPPIFLPKNSETTEEFINILNSALDNLKTSLENTKDSIDNVLSSYYRSLNNDKYYIIESIKNYCFIVGATNQKSDSDHIWKRKLKDYADTTNKYYDNILLDEAARSNPLDLMIPMSLAKNRIIIVGDHRQLPHITEDNIVKRLEEDETYKADIKSMITTSMFENLFVRLKKLEKRDNIKRTITLDNQYRTHPLLGQFVSDNFYKNDSVEIKSPRPESDFIHNLPGLDNRPCMWIDVAGRSEIPIKTGGYIREAEAYVIAKHIKMLLDSEAGSGLTFGVITFYKKQVELLKDVFMKSGIYEFVNGVYSVVEKYKDNIVLVGSVDAFQGREFDVVYLSTVRSNLNNNIRSYGFLKLESRLCVSMSRQKRLLIAVGDVAMFDNEMARRNVPGLYNFLQLCRSRGVMKNGKEFK